MTTLSLPQAPVSRWLEAARERHSRRSFDGTPLRSDLLEAMAEATRQWQSDGAARVALVPEATEALFKGIVGGYGRITGAPSALAMIGSSELPVAQVSTGYVGEALVLEATALGMGTCWVGGMFNAEAVSKYVELAPGERVFAVSPIGMALQKVSSTEKIVYRMKKPKPRKLVIDIAPDFESGEWPSWARPGVEVARIAPSANNRQPWRFRADSGDIVISFDGPESRIVSKRLDCGIAMLHFELAVRAAGASGAWEVLEHRSDVARFSLGSA